MSVKPSRILYGLDDYSREREKVGRIISTRYSDYVPVVPEASKVNVNPTGSTAVPVVPVVPEAPKVENTNDVAPSSPTTHTSMLGGNWDQRNETPSGAVNPESVSGGSDLNVLTQAGIDLTRPLSQIDIARDKMEKARQKVYDVLNRKFVYNAKASPLYSILQQQYEKQAQKAAGEAYARAVANTGGYGSSYATLAAAEARRQTMEGFNDQQLALYQAAKDEFMTERESAVDWYNQMRQMYSDVEDETLSAAYDAAYTLWDGTNEDTVRQALLGEGVSADQVDTILKTLRTNHLGKLETDSKIEEIEQSNAYKSALGIARDIWKSPEDEAAVREALAGTDATTVDAIISTLKSEYLGNMQTDADIENETYNQQLTNATLKAYELYSSGKSADEIRAELTGIYPAAVVESVLSEMSAFELENKKTQAALKEFEEQTLSDDKVTEATSYLLTNFQGFAEGTMRRLLESTNQYTKEQIDEAIENARGVHKATLEDSKASVSDISTAISYKNELDAARRNGLLTVQEYDEAISQNSAYIMDEVNKHINNLSKVDYQSLGISKETWDSLDDSDKKLALFDVLGELAAENVITGNDYYKLLWKDTKGLLESTEYKNSNHQVRDLLDRGVILQDLYNSGYMSSDDYVSLMTEFVVPEIEKTSVIQAYAGQLVFNLNTGVGEISDEQAKVVGDILKFSGQKHLDRNSRAWANGARGSR